MKTEHMFNLLAELLGEKEPGRTDCRANAAALARNDRELNCPPVKVTCMDSEITASDEELLAYFRGIMLQKRIDRMDLIERMTHAAASLSGKTPEEEYADFHEALRAKKFDFQKALNSYLIVFGIINRA